MSRIHPGAVSLRGELGGLKIPGRGGSPRRVGVAGRGALEGVCGEFGGGAKYVFSEPKFPPRAQNTPKNATHPKTQVMAVPKICVFGCTMISLEDSLLCDDFPLPPCECRVYMPQGCANRTYFMQYTLRGRQNTPENATRPKSQIFRTASYLHFRMCCVFGCVLAPS